MDKKDHGTAMGCLLSAGAIVAFLLIVLSDMERFPSTVLALIVILIPIIFVARDSSEPDEYEVSEDKENTPANIRTGVSGGSVSSDNDEGEDYQMDDDEWVDYQMWDNYQDTGKFF